ncbi:glucosylglycerol-phosphate synthase [Cognatazoarcus halotolerans]|uniref:glucosylglycerol-phosphate synthase n=1 Tax=Cognatazoarcus halotolerans TaxID=2686016 RepID=UPI00135981EA|nr:glucosylglycerol-phosphate synthase [Cognatazoarcus halotolerans]MCB1897895.1 glucosylglycerol-phosphate synthase [Rhodocyclaceae bacterium]MCP5310591.1 glucosylglycerol-phosphate synthase [Zoogloeaceae bacterium]
MLIATDLDGTFLAGEAESRNQLYQLIADHSDIKLVFVTGRGLEVVMPLLTDPTIPSPDYIICDVGATIVEGNTLQPVQPIQQQIEKRWPGERAVASALSVFPDLERQDVPQQRRCSYFCAPGRIPDGIDEVAAKLGCDVLYSADRYLDILPPDTNKGSTLRKLVDLLEIDPDDVLVAGDTLNDLSMYEAGFKGVCVGESERALLEATRDRSRAFHARHTGCGGILEAIVHFNFIGEGGLAAASRTINQAGKSELVMVYHRLPYEEAWEDGKQVRRRHTSPNGILPTLLSFFGGGRKGAWVAWSVHDARRGAFETHTRVEPRKYPELVCARVPLSKQEVDIFYKRFSKEAFWPTLHTFWERARFREDDWEVYLKVNRLFAERTAAEAAEGATVWIHDYNLWMVPAFLREFRPDLVIGFFHHTYFPSADVFNVLPWRREIVGSLLQCDYIGFHIPRQAENFVDVARGVASVKVLEVKNCAPTFRTYGCAVGLEEMTTAIEVHGRRIGLGAHPVGLDIDRVKAALAQPETTRRMESLRSDLKGQRMILSVERLDYTKGTLEKLEAFDQLLDEYPELQGKVTLLTICVPAAREMTIYRTLQTQIEQAVGRINGRYSRVGWTPVQFFFRAFPFDEVVAYYAMADVMWITPLRDGLNLVCKEYVATQGLTEGSGVLVLSEFAGAAAELHGAILTNPHDPKDLRDKCYYATTVHRNEARTRLREQFDIVRSNDLQRWADGFLAALQESARQARKHAEDDIHGASITPLPATAATLRD